MQGTHTITTPQSNHGEWMAWSKARWLDKDVDVTVERERLSRTHHVGKEIRVRRPIFPLTYRNVYTSWVMGSVPFSTLGYSI
jgi:hypothetical protein